MTASNPHCDHGVLRRVQYSENTWVCSNNHFPDCHFTVVDQSRENAEKIFPVNFPAVVNTGIGMIANERQRQIRDKGYDKQHDKHHRPSQLAAAASAYIEHARGAQSQARYTWPWRPHEFKPGTVIEDLTRAGALCAAAIDRHKELNP